MEPAAAEPPAAHAIFPDLQERPGGTSQLSERICRAAGRSSW